MAENGIMSDFFARDEPSFRHRRIRRIRRIWLSCPNPGRQRPSWKCRSRRRHRRCFEMLWIGSSSRILQKSFRMFFQTSFMRFSPVEDCWDLFIFTCFHFRFVNLDSRVAYHRMPLPGQETEDWRGAQGDRQQGWTRVRCVEASLTQTLFLSWLVDMFSS